MILFVLVGVLSAAAPEGDPLAACREKDAKLADAEVGALRADVRLVVRTRWQSDGSQGDFQDATLLLEPATCAYVGLTWASIPGSAYGLVFAVSSGAVLSETDLVTLLQMMALGRADPHAPDPRDELTLRLTGWRPGLLPTPRDSVAPADPTSVPPLEGCHAPLNGACACPCFSGVRGGTTLKRLGTRAQLGVRLTSSADHARVTYQHAVLGVEDLKTKRHLWLDGRASLDGPVWRDAEWVWWPSGSDEGFPVLTRLSLQHGTVSAYVLHPIPEIELGDRPLVVTALDASGVTMGFREEPKLTFRLPWKAIVGSPGK